MHEDPAVRIARRDKPIGALRLLVADDHAVVRKGLCAILQEQPDWVVAGEASDGRQAVERAQELRPDIAVIDVSMPILNGIEATRQIVKQLPRVKVLVLTMHDSEEVMREMIEAGAQGYLLKSDAGTDLVHAIRSLGSNKRFFTSKADQMLLDGYLHDGPKPDGGRNGSVKQVLTTRQREILQLLAEGKSSKEVAADLGLSLKTVETHRVNIMRRLDCHSVTELVRYAVRNRIIEA